MRATTLCHEVWPPEKSHYSPRTAGIPLTNVLLSAEANMCLLGHLGRHGIAMDT